MSDFSLDMNLSPEALEKQLSAQCPAGRTPLQFLIESNKSDHINVLYSESMGKSSYEWYPAPRNMSSVHLAAKQGSYDTFKAVVDHLDDDEKLFELAGSNDRSVLNIIVSCTEELQDSAASKISHLFQGHRYMRLVSRPENQLILKQ